MKLNELFDTEIDNTIHKDIEDKPIGDGIYSKVFNSKSDPHMVNKLGNRESDIDIFNSEETYDKDPYWLYINAVIKLGLAKENPHFPRVYKINKNTNRIQLEKLISYDEIELELIRSYAENNFVLDSDITKDEIYSSEIYQVYMTNIIERGKIDKIRSETLIQATQLLHKLKKYCNESNPKIMFDLHAHNVMYRRTSKGIELVITDPFAGTGDTE